MPHVVRQAVIAASQVKNPQGVMTPAAQAPPKHVACPMVWNPPPAGPHVGAGPHGVSFCTGSCKIGTSPLHPSAVHVSPSSAGPSVMSAIVTGPCSSHELRLQSPGVMSAA